MTDIDWNALLERRNTWVAYNFPSALDQPQESVMGVIEELGELAHAHLKERQNIRGTAEEHRANARDALGDITIYLLGVMNSKGVLPRPSTMPASSDIDQALFLLSSSVGRLSLRTAFADHAGYQVPVNRIIRGLTDYAEFRGWDYGAIVMETWSRVEQRDWIKYPDTGRPPDGDQLLTDGGETVPTSPANTGNGLHGQTVTGEA